MFSTIDALPLRARTAFATPLEGDLFSTRCWYDTVIASGLPPGAAASFAVAGGGDLTVPLMRAGRRLGSLTTPYTCVFAPIAAADATAARLAAAAGALARSWRAASTVRLEALAEGCATVEALATAARSAGLVAVRFLHFGNWSEPTAGVGWDAYLASRDGALRETVRRKLRRLRTTRLELIATTDDVERGVTAYEHVYARSWKSAEPSPNFNPALMRATAALGVLRLALLHDGDVPVAAQFWVLLGGRATVLKLAHDEARRAGSPGTVLTALVVRHLLDRERVTELDFGRGDDPYKRLWTSVRRQRVGLMLANPRRPGGLAFLARHSAGRLRHALAV